MKTRFKCEVIFLIAAVFASMSALDHSEEIDSETRKIEDLLKEVNALSEARRFDEGIEAGRRALEKSKNRFGLEAPLTAGILHALGDCYYRKEAFDECLTLWHQALAIQEKILRPDHPETAKTLNSLALGYRALGEYGLAESACNRSLEIRKTGLPPDHPDTAESLCTLAILYEDQSKFEKAEHLFKEALQIRKRALGSRHRDVASNLNSLAILYKKTGRYSMAEKLYRQAIEIWEENPGPEHPDLAKCQNNLAILYWQQGKYAEAEYLFKEAQQTFEKILGPEHSFLARNLNSLASLYRKWGRYKEAEILFKRAIRIKKKVMAPDHPSIAASLHNLVNLYIEQGRYAEAENHCKQALNIREHALGPDHIDVAHSLDSLGTLYAIQGKYKEAEKTYIRSLRIRKQVLGPEHTDTAESMDHLAAVYAGRKKYGKAEKLYLEALDIRKRKLEPGHPDVTQCLQDLASLYRKLGKYWKAEEICREALAGREKILGAEHTKTCESMEDLAILYALRGYAHKSLIYFQKLQKSRERFIEYVFSYASEDQKMRYVNLYPLADHAFYSFTVETLRSNRTETTTQISPNFENHLKKTAFETALKSKAVVIDAMSAEKKLSYGTVSPEICQKTENHAKICSDISNLVLAGTKNLDTKIFRGRLRSLYRIKDNLETELSGLCAAFKDELDMRRFTVADVVRSIPPGSVLWEFVRYDSYDFKNAPDARNGIPVPRYLAFTCDHDGCITLTDLGKAEDIDRLIHGAMESIENARKDVYSSAVISSEATLKAVTGRLYQKIFAPLLKKSGRSDTLLISPDGQLSLFPFEILPCPDGKYAVEKYIVSYVSSGRDLIKFGRGVESGHQVIIMADPDFDFSTGESGKENNPLKKDKSSIDGEASSSRDSGYCLEKPFEHLYYSRREGEAIKNAIGANTTFTAITYYGDQALERVLKGLETPPRALHLATHGFFCGDIDRAAMKQFGHPLLRSGLALAGANRSIDGGWALHATVEDGILTAFEASGLNLSGTELVVLSACQTGLGEIRNGEGVYGLRRAFQHAGARTIVMSLWKIPDKETFEIMDHFYQYWTSGISKREALRGAVLNLLKTQRKKYQAAHPLLWGAFVMVGDPLN